MEQNTDSTQDRNHDRAEALVRSRREITRLAQAGLEAAQEEMERQRINLKAAELVHHLLECYGWDATAALEAAREDNRTGGTIWAAPRRDWLLAEALLGEMVADPRHRGIVRLQKILAPVTTTPTEEEL
jgi:hypothetical protein